jgi:hypothetical protein
MSSEIRLEGFDVLAGSFISQPDLDRKQDCKHAVCGKGLPGFSLAAIPHILKFCFLSIRKGTQYPFFNGDHIAASMRNAGFC